MEYIQLPKQKMKIQFEFVLRVEMETPRQNRRMTLRSTLSSFDPGDPASCITTTISRNYVYREAH